MDPEIAIRPFTDEDYEFLAATENAVYDEYPYSVEQYRHQDATRDPALFHVRHVVEVEGHPAACGSVGHSSWIDDPNKYWFAIYVAPDINGNEVRPAYLAFVTELLAPRSPVALMAGIVESRPEYITFLLDHGFKEVQREHMSRIDLQAFEPDRFAEAVGRVADQGIRLVRLSELQGGFSDWPQRVHPVYQQLIQDMPSPDEPRRDSLEQWQRRVVDSPSFDASLWMLAFDGDRVVGISQAGPNLEDSTLIDCEVTGVLASHRRRGIATALKAKLLEASKETGALAMTTGNEQNNPMYDINIRLGFVPRPDWVEFEKVL